MPFARALVGEEYKQFQADLEQCSWMLVFEEITVATLYASHPIWGIH